MAMLLMIRAPNLGGLCRTCEIFNADMLVLHSLKAKDDAAFKSLAVTSDKWMPMSEVAERDVEVYLREKKSQGYSILGLEQANNRQAIG